MAENRKAVHFGGGNIGRGFMAPIFRRSNYEIVFVDVDASLVQKLQAADWYHVRELDSTGQAVKTEKITNFCAINSRESLDSVVQEIATATIVTCAVGPNVLPFLGEAIARGIEARDDSLPPVAVVACENMVRATDALQKHVLAKMHADAQEQQKKKAIFSNSAVDRVVPQDQDADSLDVKVEQFFEWCIEEGPFADNPPPLELAHFVKNLDYYIERKLYTVNTAHAITAYFAHQQHIPFIHEAIAKQEIETAVRKALQESSDLIVSIHKADKEEQQEYVDKVIGRFRNPALNDTPNRVGRGPLRKLGLKERLVGPANGLAKKAQSYDGLAKGIEMALRFQNVEGDAESERLAKYMHEADAERAAKDILSDQLKSDETLEVGGNIETKLFHDFAKLVQKVQKEPCPDSAAAAA